MFVSLSIAGVVVAALLGWNLARRLAAEGIGRLKDRRRASSRLVSSAELIDGVRHVPVSLALNHQALYYENADMQASLDLEWIQEVEYDDELVTGQRIRRGNVLRLRCYGQVFEFILPAGVLQKWQAVLPARHGVVSAAAADASLRDLSRADDDGWALSAR
jgi:hypothetical protein